ncbi:erythromycin esterase family protein [Spirillospora sp. CA-255316]
MTRAHGQRADDERAAAVRWIAGRARPLGPAVPDAPPDDLEPLRALADGAAVVGLGASTRGAHEVSVLQHRILRFLVEEAGFRTLALEEDWTTGLLLDAHVLTGEGDPRTLLRQMWLPWQTRELLDVLAWMRAYNERHPDDPVRFVGVDMSTTRAAAYDAVAEYVRRAAPGRLPELEEHHGPLRPDPAAGIDEHVGRYRRLPDKRPLIRHAEKAYDLVAGLPAAQGRDLALHHARAIVDFHRFHSRPVMEALPYVERRMAENILWWREHTGSKIVYWGGIGHSAAGLSLGGPGDEPRRNTGGLLRERLGTGYRSMALTFGRGAVHGGVPVPHPSGDYADSVFDEAAPSARYLADLRDLEPGEETAGAWLDAPAKLRVIGPGYRAEDDADHHMAGGTVRGWLDAVVHTREVTPARFVPADGNAPQAGAGAAPETEARSSRASSPRDATPSLG